MKFRSNGESLQPVWGAGCAFAGLLFLVAVFGWSQQVGPRRGMWLAYGMGAVVVLVYSRGLYHRSIVSGVLLLFVALGPVVRGAIQWTVDGVEFGPSVLVLVEGAVALFGLGLSVMVVRAIYDLSREETSRPSHHRSRVT